MGAYEKLLFYRPSYERAHEVRERYAALLLRLERFDDAAEEQRTQVAQRAIEIATSTMSFEE